MFKAAVLSVLLLGGSLGLAGCAALAAQEANTPRPYLVKALAATQRHDSAEAIAELNKAESLWISGNVPFSSPFFEFDPDAMRNMARARQAIEMQRWGDAEYYIRTALTHPSVVTPG